MSNASSLPQFQPLPHHGQQQFSPPSHPPPHPRLDPPQVTRTSEAEADEPDGEAPPSYEAVVTTHPNQTLPPQRVGEANRPQQGQQMGQGHFRPSDGGAAHLVPPGQSLYHYPYSQQHAYAQQSFPLHTGPPGSLPYAPYPHQGFPPQQSHPHLHHGSFANVHVTGPGRYPPPGALVLQPGDPRIGGRLCFHCDGTGTIEGLFFGDDICERCQGVGRLFAP
ncbi:hypothetical protein K437DRAFT_181154 [Tilletiaria anomala UBC 951]|uniref:Uncharacterized protein n=1 Tax=Tilletiaria anomala (strain ATCC 24038 / CBS 436.72 / UBC 951) TaxID=1037660 RepID=A0A066VKY6_TILAU|nr:uncharacterized protein K437DRAFT_181154 [Tilletiaria anomala UBC 951]KDN40958.1 hypothetical protein K437DRAFT_181154 [Tilletiaria anomala UBC 951]